MSIIDLWQPIVGSAIALFFVSALVWMVFPWHKKDYAEITNEGAARDALKGLAPGTYSVPCVTDAKEFKNEAVLAKYNEGPVGFLTIIPSGAPTMGGKLISVFLYYVVVSCICAYMVTRTLPIDANYLSVFRIAGTTAFLAYGVAYVQESIWFGRPWSLTIKGMWDALIHAAVTGGMFGWLAP